MNSTIGTRLITGFVLVSFLVAAAGGVGIFGTGKVRPLGGVIGSMLAAVATARAARPELRLVAVDLPSGLNADTGRTEEHAVVANVTATIHMKIIMYGTKGSTFNPEVKAFEAISVAI